MHHACALARMGCPLLFAAGAQSDLQVEREGGDSCQLSQEVYLAEFISVDLSVKHEAPCAFLLERLARAAHFCPLPTSVRGLLDKEGDDNEHGRDEGKSRINYHKTTNAGDHANHANIGRDGKVVVVMGR